MSFSKSKQSYADAPLCYYHKGQPIKYFCKNSNCTLPLCQKCLDIHKVQHINKKQIPTQNVLSYEQAKIQILQKIKQKQNLQQKKQQQINSSLQLYRFSIVEYVDQIIHKLRENILIQDGCLKQVIEIKALQKGIKQNSLKDLIESYQKYLDFKPQNYVTSKQKYSINEKELKQVIQNGVLNPIINTRDQRRKSQNVIRNSTLDKEDHNQRSSKSFKRRSIFNKQKQQDKNNSSTSIKKLQETPIKSNKIYDEKEVNQSSSDVKQYKIQHQIDQEINNKSRNIYTDENYEVRFPISKQNVQNSRVSKISSTYSNKSGKGRKGLSLTKIKASQNNNLNQKLRQSKLRSIQKVINSEEDLGNSSLRKSVADWKKVVKMNQSPRYQNKYSRVLTEQNEPTYLKRELFKLDSNEIDVMSPSQMRQFLKRKNNQKKLNGSSVSSMNNK